MPGSSGSGGARGGGGVSSSSGKSGSSSGKSSSGSSSGSSTSSRSNPAAGNIASPYTYGGGKPVTIANAPFAGRTYGGATRPGIYAGAGFGAGYGASSAYSSVAGRNFGYGFWPLYWYPGYYGDDEYGSRENSSRPGGDLQVAYYNPPYLNDTQPPQYAAFGDSKSIDLLRSFLESNCSAILMTNQSLIPQNTPPANISRVIEYYRESSFALESYFVNATAGETPGLQEGPIQDGTANVTTAPYYLYPSSDYNQTFETCMNLTIGNNLAIGAGVSAATVSVTVPPLFALLFIQLLSIFYFKFS